MQFKTLKRCQVNSFYRKSQQQYIRSTQVCSQDKTDSEQCQKTKPKFRRVMLKISGSSLADSDSKHGLNHKFTTSLAEEIANASKQGVQLAIAVGGGNFVKGAQLSNQGVDRATADYVGMIATVINCLCIQEAIEKHDVSTRVVSALEILQVAEPFSRRRVLRHLSRGRVVIFAGGTGNPLFSTDTAAALRASEIDADVLIKASDAPGLFDKDPSLYPNAVLQPQITYAEVPLFTPQPMDDMALTLAQQYQVPVCVQSAHVVGNMYRACMGECAGTWISDEGQVGG